MWRVKTKITHYRPRISNFSNWKTRKPILKWICQHMHKFEYITLNNIIVISSFPIYLAFLINYRTVITITGNNSTIILSFVLFLTLCFYTEVEVSSSTHNQKCPHHLTSLLGPKSPNWVVSCLMHLVNILPLILSDHMSQSSYTDSYPR